MSAPAPHAPASDAHGALASYVDGEQWVCVFCTHRNELPGSPGGSLRSAHCAGCGLSFRGGHSRSTSQQREPRPWASLWSRTFGSGVEIAIATGLFLFWRLADVWAGSHSSGAVSRGRSVANLERSLGLPSERSLQSVFLPHRHLLQALNTYYVAGHVPVLLVLAGWLSLRHRAAFGLWRSRFIAVTAVSFAIQLVTVAPPRLVPGLGVSDTARALGESVYAAKGGGFADQLASLPSVHVAWALLTALAVISLLSSPWRWLVVLHPLTTLVTVVATGNHYWMDALAAVVLVVSGVTGLRARGGSPDRSSQKSA